ncbi:MAG TPA: PLP-dependent aspartate aminotransferase family protein, partial [Burkholderiaceae bacterium]|nr:PLP-dependent aspartate aminotransferase family protein [Burkholderiaceae bacterium]
MKVATEIVQLGRPPSGPVNTPVYRASTIVFDTLDEFERAKDHERHALTYGRYGTPTTFSLEEAIARIEGAFAAALVPSGLSAITTALQAFLRPGDHLLLPDSVYGPARRFATQFLEPRGISASYYPAACGAGISQFLRPDTRVVYLESPGSLTFEMQDVPAICSVCKPRGIVTVADNTWATPLLFKPLAHGVDVSLQAGTKYLVGHSDAMIGTIAATQSCWNMIESTIVQLGLCVAPDEAYLAARGLRTMPVRLAQHARNAMAVASWLERQPQVARVCYPALESDPGHAIWQRDYRGASGLMGVFLKPLPQLQA